jgi:hypothetical protein
VSEIETFGGKSDFYGNVKNCKLFEELATSFCNSVSIKIATRKAHEANRLTFYDTVNLNSFNFYLKTKF